MQSADCVLVDGTFWTDEEMIGLGLSKKRARDIGHLPQSGAGRHARVAGPSCPQRTRRILIHINNTNPILDEDSAERAELRAPRHRGRLATAWRSSCERDALDARRNSSAAARARPRLPHPPSLQRDAQHRQGDARSRSAAGWRTASTTRSTSRSRMPRSSPTATTAPCGATGCSASSITTATAMTRAASTRGCAWPRRWDCTRAGGARAWRRCVPGVRFAVDAYVNFARRAPWPEAVCSSLTELFAPEIHKQRLATWPRALSVDRAGGPEVLPEPREPGAARRRVRAGDRRSSASARARSRSGRSRCCSSSSTCCGR